MMLPFLGFLVLGLSFLFPKDAGLEDLSVQRVNPPTEVGQAEEFWRNEIKKNGPEKTYEFFRTAYLGEPAGIQHSMAHIIGEILYDFEGVSGIGFCDQSYSFGCFHSFSIFAIHENSEKIVPDLYKNCLEKSLSPIVCSHGLGHGLTAYFSSEYVDQAFSACETIPDIEAVRSCIRGAVMEYNFDSMHLTGVMIPRDLTEENKYGPCSLLPESLQDVCFFETANWWAIVSEKNFASVVHNCRGIVSEENKIACFRGMGSASVEARDFATELVKRDCNLAEEYEPYCRAGAAWLMFVSGKNYKELCNLQPEAKKTCNEHFLAIEAEQGY